jgi:hypothetical protein
VTRTLLIALIIMLSIALAGCGASQPDEEDTASLHPQVPPSQEALTDTPENPLQLGNTPESQEMPSNPPPVEKFVALARKDLASRLQIDMSKISLVKSEQMMWPNVALGCPRPGKFYPQGKVPGYRIWLNAEGKEYLYHTDYNGQLILCPEMNPDIPGSTTTPTPRIGVPID